MYRRVCAVLGDPVEHTLSPALHNAGYAALGLPFTYVALRVRKGGGARAVDAIRTLHLAGASVTMPLKAEVAAAADRRTPDVARLGVANTLVVDEDGTVTAHNTDVHGIREATREAGLAPRAVLLLGGGGAAHAAAAAFAGCELYVATREGGRRLDAPAHELAWGEPPPVPVDLLVNATPLGMDAKTCAASAAQLASAAAVFDMVYAPAVTPLLAAARAAGKTAVGGLPMLLHQAGAQFELFTGVPAPLEAMRAAVPHDTSGGVQETRR